MKNKEEANGSRKSLKIVQFATSFIGWGGTELHILNLSAQLKDRGHDVTIACRPGMWLESKALEMGLQTIAFDKTWWYDVKAVSSITRYLHKARPDVVHAHWSADIVAGGITGLIERVPVRVLSRHLPYTFKTKLAASLYTGTVFTKTVTVSDSVRRVLLKSGVSAERVQVIHHGTDIEKFRQTTVPRQEVRSILGLREDEIAVAIIGRIAEEKGHKYLIDSLLQIRTKTSVRVLVVGSGPDEDYLKAYAKELGVEDRLVFLGFRDDVNNIINAVDIVAVPSTWDEPCSAVIQQAMAIEKPVIGTDTGGSPEMIIHGLTGLLVPPNDSLSIAAAIDRLAEQPAEREQMGDAAYDRVQQCFSLRGMVDKIEALYYRELKNSAASFDA